QGFRDLAGVGPSTLGAFWPATAFAADDRGNFLNDFVSLKSRCEPLGNCGNQRDASICDAGKKNRTLEFCLESVRYRAKQFSVAIWDLRYACIASCMRRREFVRYFRCTSLQVSLSSFSSSFLPIVNLGLKFFQMRRSRVDLFKQL